MWKFGVIEGLPSVTLKDAIGFFFSSVLVQYFHAVFMMRESLVTVIISLIYTGCKAATSQHDYDVRDEGTKSTALKVKSGRQIKVGKVADFLA